MMMTDETDNMSEGTVDEEFGSDSSNAAPATPTKKIKTSRRSGKGGYPGVVSVAGQKVLDDDSDRANASSQSSSGKCFISKWGTLFLVLFLSAMVAVVVVTMSAPIPDPVTVFGKTYNPHRTTKIELSLEEGAAITTIPTELALLTKLTHLDLSSNPFKGTIPSELTTLTGLKHLNLGDCIHLEGTIPAQLSELTHLEYLELAINSLTGVIPNALGLLTKLTYMDLMSNQLEGGIPSGLSTLTRLTHLSLLDNRLSGTVPTELTDIAENLSFLFLSHNELTGSVPYQFCDADTYVRIDCQEMRCVCCKSGEIGAPRCPNFEYNAGN